MIKSDAKKNKSEKRHTIASLKEENKILRAEIKRLNRALRIHSASSEDKKRNFEKKRELKIFESVQSTAIALAASSYLKYIFTRISRAALYSLFKKIMSGFRKFKLVSTMIRIISSILAILGTGAFFIFISGTVIFFIPIFILLCAAAYVAGMLFRKKAFKLLEAILCGKNILVFFPPMGRAFQKSSCFQKTIELVSNETNIENFSLIVSPHLISSKGLGGKGYYPVMRMEKVNVCIIRRNAFFALRKKLLRLYGEKISYIY